MRPIPVPTTVRVGVVGELREGFLPHEYVNANLAQASCGDRVVQSEWISTEALTSDAESILRCFHALWIAPGSPYRSLDGALNAIRYAREHRVPLLGTCGGFQHIIVEFGRSVMGLRDAGHEETDPEADCLIVTALTCAPAGQSMPVRLDSGSRPADWYGATDVVERYFCNYGINPAYEAPIHHSGLRIVGRDHAGEPRVVELDGHPFFIGALFVPQPTADGAGAHPLVAQLINAGARRSRDQDRTQLEGGVRR
jgi:CTP synthase (UTP-ammonia lyase)